MQKLKKFGLKHLQIILQYETRIAIKALSTLHTKNWFHPCLEQVSHDHTTPSLIQTDSIQFHLKTSEG